MKLLSPFFVAPAVLAILSSVAGCSSDSGTPNDTAGASPGGAGAGGKAGSAGSSGASVSGGAGGSAGSVSTAGSAGAATAGSAGGTAVEASFATVKGIIKLTCFGNGCHGQEGNPLQLAGNDDAKLYATLTTHVTMNCGMLVNKANPAASALVKVLQGDCGTPPNVTPRMPFQTCFDGDTDPESPCIQPDKIAAIQAWIAKGAPQQ
ncbi:MAG TPA: hypothetical protein VER12_08825 [Polyangiaceae bacterium]|nr:hypothetical protein [Polyangiaceae bacterium]